MAKKIFFLCLTLLITVFSHAAEPDGARINGIIKEGGGGDPMEFVTVVLLDTAQNIIATAVSDIQGRFIFNNIARGTYQLKVSSLGHVTQQITVEVTAEQQELNIPPINMAAGSKQLEAVTITARRPLMERKIDKLVMNVADALSTEGSNGMDVLRKAPGVVIDSEGNITLNGQAVAVWIDNRPSHLSGRDLATILNALDGSNIDKIEIIQNPSSKYDAAGAAGIINILTKKNFLKGINGSVQVGGGYYIEDESGDYYNANGGVNLNYRNEWINTIINASARGGEGFSTTGGTTYYGQTRHETFRLSEYKNPNQTLKLTNDFFIDKKNIIGFIASGMWNKLNIHGGDQGWSEIYQNDALIEYSISRGKSDRTFTNYAGNLNYQHLFGSSHDLLVNVDYMKYTADQRTKEENYFDNILEPNKPELNFMNTAEQEVGIFSAKADYTKPLGSIALLEAGGKFAQSITDNQLLREDYLAPSGNWQRNDTLSNAYRYKERISALYLSLGMQLGAKWNAKAGVRWENTWSRGDWQNPTGDTTTYQNYNNFFPTAFVGYALSPKHYFAFSYTMRIQRPGYETLNPFRQYASAYTYGEGNPNLRPQYSHMVSLGYNFNRFLGINFFVQYNTRVIVQIIAADTATAVTSILWDNFGNTTYSGFTASVSQLPVTKWWSFNFQFSGFYIESTAPGYNKSAPYANTYLENTFLIGKTWKAEISGNARTSVLSGYFKADPNYTISAGIRKNLWENKGTLSLYIDDIFNTDKSWVNSNRNGQEINMGNTWSSRQIRFSFSYRFGKAIAKRSRIGEVEESSRLGEQKAN